MQGLSRGEFFVRIRSDGLFRAGPVKTGINQMILIAIFGNNC